MTSHIFTSSSDTFFYVVSVVRVIIIHNPHFFTSDHSPSLQKVTILFQPIVYIAVSS